jgi:hypothetical protein
MPVQVVRYGEQPDLWAQIEGLTDEVWPESWTGMRFPDTGDYVFPRGLATVHIDRTAGTGDYWEPNIWLIHDVKPEP